MNEKLLQYMVYRRIRAFHEVLPAVIPNIYHFAWESDLLYITKSGYATEFEIKCSYSDFKADQKKIIKHKMLSGERNDEPMRLKNRIPKYFWYVCPEGIIPLREIPKYAGLIYIRKGGNGYSSITMRQAPLLKSTKLTDGQMLAIFKKGLGRYWSSEEKNHR